MDPPFVVNCFFDLYSTGYDPAHPFPTANQAPVLSQAPGFLQPQMVLGRFGYQTKNLYFTHTLDVINQRPYQDAYNSQLDPARNNALSGMVVIADTPIPGKCSAFYVVAIQRLAIAGPKACYRIYLDRAQPRAKPNPGKVVNGLPCIFACCANDPPNTLYLTLTDHGGCGGLNGVSIALNLNTGTNKWEGSELLLGGILFTFKLYCQANPAPLGWYYSFLCGGGPELAFGPTINVVFEPFLLNETVTRVDWGGCCTGTLTVNVTQ